MRFDFGDRKRGWAFAIAMLEALEGACGSRGDQTLGCSPRSCQDWASNDRFRIHSSGERSDSALARIAAEVASMEEVMDFYRLAGDAGNGLRAVVADAAAFDAFYKRLIGLMPLKSILSRFALEVIKSETHQIRDRRSDTGVKRHR